MAYDLVDIGDRLAALEKAHAMHFGAIGALMALVSARPASQHLGEVDGRALPEPIRVGLQEWERATAVLQLAILDEYAPGSTNVSLEAGFGMVRKAFADATHSASPTSDA